MTLRDALAAVLMRVGQTAFPYPPDYGVRADAPRRGDREPVFFGPKTGDRLRGDTASHALPRILKSAGLAALAPHALRHGAATLMLADGVPMRVIAEQLGHSNPSLTARVYAHVIPEQQRRAVGSLERVRKR